MENASKVLTARELEVLELLKQGLTNKEIAARLVVGYGTVRAHVANILHKLDVPSRAAAAAYDGLNDHPAPPASVTHLGPQPVPNPTHAPCEPEVKLITDPDDSEFLAGLDLYDANLANLSEEVVPGHGLMQSLQANLAAKTAGEADWDDYFLVVRRNQNIDAFFYAFHQHSEHYVYISTIVARGQPGELGRNQTIATLVRWLANNLRPSLMENGCKGMLLEVADTPRRRLPAAHIGTADARARHFKTLARREGLVLKELSIRYKNAKGTHYGEFYSRIMYARFGPEQLKETISKTEAEELIRCMYNLDRASFDADEVVDRQGYLDYIDQLEKEVLDGLPDHIELR